MCFHKLSNYLDGREGVFYKCKPVTFIPWVTDQNSGEHQCPRVVILVKFICFPESSHQGQATKETDEMECSLSHLTGGKNYVLICYKEMYY